MSGHRTRCVGLSAIAILTATAAVGWAGPPAEPPQGARADRDCQFAIRAYNDVNADAYVYLYDSYVRNRAAVIRSWKQLKIQNHRIAPDRSMDRRYTANGRCFAFPLPSMTHASTGRNP